MSDFAYLVMYYLHILPFGSNLPRKISTVFVEIESLDICNCKKLSISHTLNLYMTLQMYIHTGMALHSSGRTPLHNDPEVHIIRD